MTTYKKLVLAALSGMLLTGCAVTNSQPNAFVISSPDLINGSIGQEYVLNGFGCTGGNISPALEWRNLPAGTKSLALQVYDPDAPSGSGFWHWAVYNIPADQKGLARGAGNDAKRLPQGAYGGNTDFVDTGATGGNGNYGGPCPPQGNKPHRYTFTVYALSVEKIEVAAGIPKTGSAALYGFVLNKGLGTAMLGKASFTATYGR
jgi:Raf kinase inhibitor-like YbhB/YbcL family protein